MILLDSSFLIAYYNTKDNNHQETEVIMPRITSGYYGQAEITDYIFDETVTYIAARQGFEPAIKVGTNLLKGVEIVEVGKESFARAWNLFKTQHDTHLSFTDCTNIAAMKSLGMTKIVTFDHDFKSFKGISVVD